MVGVTFGSIHSMNDLGLVLKTYTVGSPSPKLTKVSVEGRDGQLDFSDYFGGIKFDNRKLEFEFTKMFPTLPIMSGILNSLHGKKLHIILDDDADFYYVGRCEVSWGRDKSVNSVKVTCECEPYKYKAAETIVTKTGSGSVTLTNGSKKVVPTITTTKATTITFGSLEVNLGIVTDAIVPELELSEGNNVLTLSGTGTTTFKYREGSL